MQRSQVSDRLWPRGLGEGTRGLGPAARTTPRSQRGLDGGRHLHCQAVLLRDAVSLEHPFEVLRRRGALRRRTERQFRTSQATPTGGEGEVTAAPAEGVFMPPE